MAVNKIFIPTFISSVDYQPVRTLPHIYFYNGLKECEPYYIEHYTNTTGSVTASVQNSFPYVDNYDGLIPTTGSRSLLFYNESTPYGQTPTASLYTTYWDKYVSLLYNPRTRLINCSAIIPLADYFEMELNDIVQWRGNYYHLRAINDYNLKDGTCNLQLLGPIISDAVTPEPADCSFSFISDTTDPSGGTITTFTSGGINYTSHTFTTSDTFNAKYNSFNAQLMVIAGGGPGGTNGGGGGGAGGLVYSSSYSVTPGTYTVLVGAGGAPVFLSSSIYVSSTSGSNSSFGSVTAIGGGGGGCRDLGLNSGSAGFGGSGGGGASSTQINSGSGIAGQGFAGGRGFDLSVRSAGGGGGGSAQTGSNGTNQQPPLRAVGGNSATGSIKTIRGTNEYWASGGGGAPVLYISVSGSAVNEFGIAGPGGGGNGGNISVDGLSGSRAQNGSANTGGGGGGEAGTTVEPFAGAGGSGIVIITYQTF